MVVFSGSLLLSARKKKDVLWPMGVVRKKNSDWFIIIISRHKADLVKIRAGLAKKMGVSINEEVTKDDEEEEASEKEESEVRLLLIVDEKLTRSCLVLLHKLCILISTSVLHSDVSVEN